MSRWFISKEEETSILFLEVELFKAVLMSLKSSKLSYEEMLGFGLNV